MPLIRLRRSPYRELELLLGYRFRKEHLLRVALTHRSHRFENRDVLEDNQRLEFLGDAVLDLVAAGFLFQKFETQDEGALTAYRSQLTSGTALAAVARVIRLGDWLLMGKGEETSGGRKRANNLADALEAVIGAAYLDGGMAAAHKMFSHLFREWLDRLGGDLWAGNPKGKLQEFCQRRWHQGPRYAIVATDGPAHALIFTCEVSLPGRFHALGKGANKRDAETRAAAEVLHLLEQKGSAAGASLIH